jgi:hypothetical protein
MMLGFIAALPVLVVFGSPPSRLISAAIIFFGMQRPGRRRARRRCRYSGRFASLASRLHNRLDRHSVQLRHGAFARHPDVSGVRRAEAL